MSARVLVAGMGNVLHGDDGFGVAVAEALAGRPLPDGVRLLEVGIGGMHLVQALLDGYEALIIVDAADRGGEPGSLFVLEPRVPELEGLPRAEREAHMADMHYTVPSRALIMAKALGILPERVWIVGCQPDGEPTLGLGLSETVGGRVEAAAELVERLIAEARSAPAAHARGGTRGGAGAGEAAGPPARERPARERPA